MLRKMSDEEAVQIEKEYDEFLLSLDWNMKSALVNLLKPPLEQLNCEHEWIDPNEYVNELDKTKKFCRKCHLTKPL